MTRLLSVFVGLVAATSEAAEIVRLDPRFDELVPRDATIEKVADGFTWTEGPVWDRANRSLLFSEVPRNVIHQWQPGTAARVFLNETGYTGASAFTGREPGSNGLAFDPEGRLVFCAHGDRAIVRLEKDGARTTLVDRYEGKRLNSPNDLVFKSNGDLYFTDPPYGLPKAFEDPGKELPVQGVYRLARDGKLMLLSVDLRGPNGIAFSPDESQLYVSDAARTVWVVFDVLEDGTLGGSKLLFDGSDFAAGAPGSADGMKVDSRGNVFAAAPGGIFVIAPEGKLLARFDLGAATGNCAWGEDGRTLFITAGPAVYRVRLTIRGAHAR